MAKPMISKYKGECKYDLCDDRRVNVGDEVKWLGKSNGVMHWECAVECGADSIVVKKNKDGSFTQFNPPKPTGEVLLCDEGCGGTGKFITRIVNGVPQGPGGIHFRCQGKGKQTDADRIRNYWYDVLYRKVHA